MDIFLEDFRLAFKTDLPFGMYGYSNVSDFINSIPSLTVKEIDNELWITSRKCNSKSTSLPSSLDYDDVSKLCVEMKNNLLLDGRNSKRTVTVRSEAPVKVRKSPLVRNHSSLSCHSEENDGEKSLSAGSVHSLHSTSSDHLVTSLEPYTGEYLTSPSYSIPTSDSYGFNEYKSTIPELNTFTPALEAFTSELNTFIPELNAFTPEQNTFIPELNTFAEANVFAKKPSACTNFSVINTGRAFDYNNFFNLSNKNTGDWLSEEAYQNSYSLLTKPVEVSDTEVVGRLLTLINSQGHRNGLTSCTVESKYKETHFTKLPNNWLHMLEKTSLVFIENLTSSIIIYPNHWFPTPPTLASLPSIKFPTREFWNVYISSFESTTCVWFRLLDDDYDLRSDILRHEMNKHYKHQIGNPNSNLDFVSKGELYAAYVKDEWVRCGVIDVEDKTVTCFLIDIGIMKRFNRAGLFQLHEKFTNTPALVLQCSLIGLEKYDGCNYINCKVRNSILNKKLKLKTGIVRSGHVISALAFVRNSLEDVEVNQAMLEIIKKELTLPKLDVNQVYDVTILSVEENTAQVQIMSPCFQLLSNSLQKAKRIIESGDSSHLRMKSMLKLKLDKMYLAKFADDSWQRILVKQFFAECFVSALFIDFGFIKMVRLGDIVECTDFPDTLMFIPPQAVQVKLLSMDVVVLKYLNEIQKPNLFSMKILNSEELVVQFFFRLPNSERRPVANLLHSTTNT